MKTGPCASLLGIAVGWLLNTSSCVQANPLIRQNQGTFSLVEDQPLFTFEYSTTAPDATNWIGIYHASGGGPVNEEVDQPSLAWKYTPEKQGTVTVSASSLEPGAYKAFFLAKDGYKWLAEPIDVAVPFDADSFRFIVSSITLHNARQGDEFSASISGLLLGGGSSEVKYSIVNQTDGQWATISDDGEITGTPSSPNNPAQLTIEAEGPEGISSQISVTIPVRAQDETLVEELKVMTYNLWHGGTRVSNYHEKHVAFLASSNADIVGLQESTPDHATRLGNALGWHVWQDTDVGIISRYPIEETYPRLGSYGGGVRISLDGECSQLNLWNAHLGYDPYGPYDFCFDQMTVEQVLKREEESGRTPQIIEFVDAMEQQLAESDTVPVVLLGDFNAPSHLDWVESLREKNCGYADVPWPSSKYPTDAGLVDSFRQAHPDPVAEEGITWSPIFLDNEGRPEPLDRIDFIYHKSDFEVLSSVDLVVGSPAPEPDHEDNEWTSDHAAVMTTFKLPAKGSCNAV